MVDLMVGNFLTLCRVYCIRAGLGFLECHHQSLSWARCCSVGCAYTHRTGLGSGPFWALPCSILCLCGALMTHRTGAVGRPWPPGDRCPASHAGDRSASPGEHWATVTVDVFFQQSAITDKVSLPAHPHGSRRHAAGSGVCDRRRWRRAGDGPLFTHHMSAANFEAANSPRLCSVCRTLGCGALCPGMFERDGRSHYNLDLIGVRLGEVARRPHSLNLPFKQGDVLSRPPARSGGRRALVLIREFHCLHRAAGNVIAVLAMLGALFCTCW